MVLVVSGTVKVLAQLFGTTASPLSYSWESPPLEPLDSQSEPLQVGGTAILRVNKGKTGQAEFEPAYLIPPEWVSFVKPALESVRAKADLWKPETASAHRPQLESLLSDANPFVAIEAARTLEQAHLLDADFVRNHLASATGWKRSAFSLLAMQQLPANKNLDLLDAPLTKKRFEK